MSDLTEEIKRLREQGFHRFSNEMMDEIEHLRNKLSQAERFITITELLATPDCWDFHHARGDRHSGSTCPIVDRYKAALKKYRDLE